MTKKLLLTFALLLAAVTGAFADDSGLCGDVSYSYVESTNTLTITGTGAMADYDYSKQPWYSYAGDIKTVVIGAGVTTIGKNAFNECSGLTSITIPANVTSIGEVAFGNCSNLATVSFAVGSQLTSIGESAFGGCEGLTSIEIPASVTSIGERAFNGCSNLATISFAEDSQLTTICEGVFYNCSNLTSITIPASVTSIGDAFAYCSKLETMTVEDGNAVYDSRNGCNAIIEKSTNTLIVGCNNSTIPDGVTSIGGSAFASCEGLTSIEIPASVTSIGNSAFGGCKGLTSVSFAEGSQLTSIGEVAFQGCEGLTSIEIPAGMTSIGDIAFIGCETLATVTVYAPSCTLGIDAFIGCPMTIYVFSDLVDYYQNATNWSDYADKITAMEMDIPHGNCGENVRWVLTGEYPNYTLTISGTGAMADYDYSKQPWYSYAGDIKTVVIGAGVTTIGKNAFNECSNLTSITIPASVTSIGRSAFNECSGLASVSFAAGSQLTSIGDYAFSISGLTSIEIPAGMTSIGEYAFYSCSDLTSITIPASVTSISVEAFSGCSNLATMTVEDGNAVYDSRNGCNAIIEKSSNTLIIGCKNSTIPVGVTSIGDLAFNFSGLTSITIPASVTTIGECAFQGCTGLTSITISAGVTTIGGYAFSGCDGLTSITIPASVTSIGDWAFVGCLNLATVTVYAPSCTLGINAFMGCNKLTNIYVFSDFVNDYKGATNWSNYAGIIREIPTPNGNCGENVRWVLTGEDPNYTLTITGTGDMENFATTSSRPWNSYAGDIKTVVIDAGVTTIGKNAFNFSGLTSITIPASVTSIGESAFGSCEGLTSITIPASVTTIGDDAFSSCIGLKSIEIPASVTTIGDWAFEGCLKLATVTVYAPSCTLGEDAFDNCGNLTNIYVLSDNVGTYKSAWSAYAGKISVMFDGTSTTTVSFDNDVTVNGVIYNRTFTASKPSTVMLPFSKDVDYISGGTFYTFGGVQKVDDKWVATMKEVTGSIEANTPYLFMPTGTSLTFTGGATLNTTGGGDKETADQGSHWTFKGTYEYMKWTTETGDPDYNAERAAEIGYAYGFAGVAKDDINVGDFVKVASGAKIRPMGCYLLWNDTPNASRAAARGAATEELPQSITVRLVGSNGETTAIGTLDTKTGEVTFDNEAWYTLDGVRLSGKPSSKGIYINNGKKVVIK